jgi:tetratricopeptide (TPR) repeat protein
VELDPAAADGVLALANVQATLLWDLPAAERSAARALELGPGVAEAHHTYGLVIFVRGRRDAALRELERARELDPLNPYYHYQLAEAQIFAGRYQDAISGLDHLLSLFPEDRVGRRDLGRAHLESGDATRAIAELQQLVPANPQLARALAKGGRSDEAKRMLPELEARSPRGGVLAIEIAEVRASLGDAAGALAWLERSRRRHEQLYLAVPFNPAFDELRSTPEYRALARRSPWPGATIGGSGA